MGRAWPQLPNNIWSLRRLPHLHRRTAPAYPVTPVSLAQQSQHPNAPDLLFITCLATLLLLPAGLFSFPTHQGSFGPVYKISAHRTSLPAAFVRSSTPARTSPSSLQLLDACTLPRQTLQSHHAQVTPPALFASSSAQRELVDGRHATPPPYATLYASLLHIFSPTARPSPGY